MNLQLDAEHRYWLGSEQVRGVSEIIQEIGLGVDYSQVPPHVLRRKADLGRRVHAVCHAIASPDPDEQSVFLPEETIQGYVDGFVRFRANTNYAPIGGERPLYHPNYAYAGTPDSFGLMHSSNKWAVIDLKTPLRVHASAWNLQVAAYRLLLLANNLIPSRAELFALQLKSSGRYKLVPLHDGDLAGQVFLAALATLRGQGSVEAGQIIRHWKLKHRCR